MKYTQEHYDFVKGIAQRFKENKGFYRGVLSVKVVPRPEGKMSILYSFSANPNRDLYNGSWNLEEDITELMSSEKKISSFTVLRDSAIDLTTMIKKLGIETGPCTGLNPPKDDRNNSIRYVTSI